ncbi:MAG: helix-turn-helix domain-containing protein, partial [Anaerolineales bacterium]|nr:helix-turn-helix domain-containing protein [Anaerolineales bacterium]
TLRETRERLGLTLDEAERTIRIRASRLETLERGEFDSLPSQVQARGFLHNYAEFLGLDPEELLRRYDESRQPKRRRSLVVRGSNQTAVKKNAARRIRMPSWFSPDILVVAIIVLGVIVVLIWGGRKLYATIGSGEDAAAVASSADAISLPTATNTPSPAVSALADRTQLTTEEPTATSTLILNVLDQVNLQVIAERESWVQVLVDGEETFKGRMGAGERYDYLGEERVEVFTGNGGGIRVIFNGQDQGLMGDVGQVVTRVWTPRGGQTPTPTQTLTPTASPEITETVTPTPIIPEA